MQKASKDRDEGAWPRPGRPHLLRPVGEPAAGPAGTRRPEASPRPPDAGPAVGRPAAGMSMARVQPALRRTASRRPDRWTCRAGARATASRLVDSSRCRTAHPGIRRRSWSSPMARPCSGWSPRRLPLQPRRLLPDGGDGPAAARRRRVSSSAAFRMQDQTFMTLVRLLPHAALSRAVGAATRAAGARAACTGPPCAPSPGPTGWT